MCVPKTVIGLTIDNNTWQHIVMTYGDYVYFYKNSISSGAKTRYEFDSTTTTLKITGHDSWQGDIYFSGLIDEVQIYNAALSSSQIKQNYLSGLNNLLSQGLISESEYNERISTLQ